MWCIEQIGEAMSSGGHVRIAFAFGVLEAKGRKFSFTFDPAAVSKGGTTPAMMSDEIGTIDTDDELHEQMKDGISTYR